MPNKVCWKCGVGEARNKFGRPVCEGCYFGNSTKHRRCKDCDKSFKTSNNSTRCLSCHHQRSKTPCPDCGELKDRRAALCRACAATTYRGANASRWKGGRTITSNGYVVVYTRDHPRSTNSGYVPEHTLVMEEHIGRFLLPGESVHHRNGIRDDNRIENLELWTVSQPKGQRAADLLAWAREIIDIYDGLPLDAH